MATSDQAVALVSLDKPTSGQDVEQEKGKSTEEQVKHHLDTEPMELQTNSPKVTSVASPTTSVVVGATLAPLWCKFYMKAGGCRHENTGGCSFIHQVPADWECRNCKGIAHRFQDCPLGYCTFDADGGRCQYQAKYGIQCPLAHTYDPTASTSQPPSQPSMLVKSTSLTSSLSIDQQQLRTQASTPVVLVQSPTAASAYSMQPSPTATFMTHHGMAYLTQSSPTASGMYQFSPMSSAFGRQSPFLIPHTSPTHVFSNHTHTPPRHPQVSSPVALMTNPQSSAFSSLSTATSVTSTSLPATGFPTAALAPTTLTATLTTTVKPKTKALSIIPTSSASSSTSPVPKEEEEQEGQDDVPSLVGPFQEEKDKEKEKHSHPGDIVVIGNTLYLTLTHLTDLDVPVFTKAKIDPSVLKNALLAAAKTSVMSTQDTVSNAEKRPPVRFSQLWSRIASSGPEKDQDKSKDEEKEKDKEKEKEKDKEAREETKTVPQKEEKEKQDKKEKDVSPAEDGKLESPDKQSSEQKKHHKTRPCVYHDRGFCRDGDKCTFLHIEDSKDKQDPNHCSVCNKTMTSPTQRKEHEAGKTHERYVKLKEANRQYGSLVPKDGQTFCFNCGSLKHHVNQCDLGFCLRYANGEKCKFGTNCKTGHVFVAFPTPS